VNRDHPNRDIGVVNIRISKTLLDDAEIFSQKPVLNNFIEGKDYSTDKEIHS